MSVLELETDMPHSVHPSTVCTEQIIGIILEALQNGCTRSAAAEGAGVARRTFYDWLDRSVQFTLAVTQAEAEAEQKATRRVTSAFEDSDSRVATQNAQWWLERRRRDDFGQKLDIRALSDDILRDLAGLSKKQVTVEAYPSTPTALLTAAPAVAATEPVSTESAPADPAI